MATNIEQFDAVVGAVFAYLYQQFPMPAEISFKQIPLEPSPTSEDNYDWSLFFANAPQEAGLLIATVDWLGSTGYLTYMSKDLGGNFYGVVLTAKGLEVLKALPSSLQTGPSLGEKLIDASKDGTKVVMRDVVSEALSIGARMATTHFGLLG